MVEVIDGVLDVPQCASLIERIEAIGPEVTRVRGERGVRVDESLRNNTRVWFDDDGLARDIWRAIEPAVASLTTRLPGVLTGTPLGCEATFRGYRYRAGERFAPHSDAPFFGDDGARTLLTVLVYLNDVARGGATRFPDDPRSDVTPARGRACVFPHALLHEGAAVEDGVKYAVRTNVVFALP